MKHFAPIALAVLACASCAPPPLTSEVVGLPTTAVATRQISFKVRVHNQGRETQILPIPYEVEYTTSLDFIPGAQPGEMVSNLMSSGKMLPGDYALNRNIISIDPPQFDHLRAGADREYHFKWTPADEDRGTGAFRIDLPYPFPELPLQPMTVVGKGSPQVSPGTAL